MWTALLRLEKCRTERLGVVVKGCAWVCLMVEQNDPQSSNSSPSANRSSSSRSNGWIEDEILASNYGTSGCGVGRARGARTRR